MLDLSKGISFLVELSISLLDKTIRKIVGCNQIKKSCMGFYSRILAICCSLLEALKEFNKIYHFTFH